MAQHEPVGGDLDLEPDHSGAVAARSGVWTTTRKVVVGVIGGTVVVAGIVSMPLPLLPGTPILLAGLAILSTEFESVRRTKDRVKDRVRAAIAERR